MDRDYTGPESIREENEAELRWEHARRRHRWLTASLVLVATGLAGLAWYAYPRLGRQDGLLSQMPATLTELQKSVFGLGEQAKAADARVTDWSGRQEELRGQLNKARGELMARIDSVRKQTSEASAALIERARSQIATQLDSIQTKLARLETSREADREQIARLEQELAQVRSQMSQQGQELASVQGRVDRNAAASEQQFASVKDTQQRDRRAFDDYADKFAVKRVDFEVAKNKGSEVAPGISLRVNSTDVSYQKVDGSIWVIPERRTIWLRQLKVQEPVFLSSFADGRTRELVITRVSKTGALGYVLVPAQETAARQVTSQVAAE